MTSSEAPFLVLPQAPPTLNPPLLIRIRIPVEGSLWISVSGCELTILPDIQLANRIVTISGCQLSTAVSVTNSSYNEYAKSCLKIYLIYFWNRKTCNLMRLFQYLFVVLFKWLTVAVEQCDHSVSATAFSTFFTSAVTDFIKHWKLHPSNICICIFNFVYSSTLLCSTIAGNFLFTQLAEGIHTTQLKQNAVLQVTHALSVSLC